MRHAIIAIIARKVTIAIEAAKAGAEIGIIVFFLKRAIAFSLRKYKQLDASACCRIQKKNTNATSPKKK